MPGEPRTGWTGWATVGDRGLPWAAVGYLQAYPGLARPGWVADFAGLETYTWYYRGHGNEFVLEYYGMVIPTPSPLEEPNNFPIETTGKFHAGLNALNPSRHPTTKANICGSAPRQITRLKEP
ncbi:hypothetical protein PAAG_07644 [Paracoccidioides lutzii Pb01]|uniref:Uncharacterized protein n=1 Tax=Paracoccidioides lutzii (strain ATCC MYA-826 / Pb01) TaxID=502779 RepID=C1HAJ0_PARBA|nr:hypothetical protein PAAG_07644 [Paracoccidioides lutzii Pb01]EEH37363.1 hypothetical protein PAAG_07644 [Paracoccidioides lutzii Pb01]